jgi:integral membrane protein
MTPAKGPELAGATSPVPAPEGGTVRRFFTLSGLDGALLRYRVLAWTVGVGLATLVFIGIPLQIAGHAGLVAIAGPIHGFFYIIYLVVALDLARRARFGFLEMIAMVGAGFLPILAFVIERRITRRVRTEVLPTWTLPRRR